MILLSINAGSSSLKVSVFDSETPTMPKTSVSIEGIGTPDACLIPEGVFGSDQTKKLPIDSHETASGYVKQWLTDELSIAPSDILAIGHRVVHGGNKFDKSTVITDETIEYLESITSLAPNHMPATLASLRAFRITYPDLTHVACFDTSFFHDLPEVSKLLTINRKVQDEFKMRRFGFHGISYESLLDSFRQNEGEEAAKGRIIMAHLGSGASVTACVDGKPIDTSMGFTPVSGIMMSTRTGDLEPGVVTYLQKQGMSLEEVSKLVTYESGLLGISGKTADMYTLIKSRKTDPDAKIAVDLFCYKVKKQIGAYMAALGGVDSIIFSGGIGERSAGIRSQVLGGLEFASVYLDNERNEQNARCISSDHSAVGVHVIQAREDVTIIKQTLALIN